MRFNKKKKYQPTLEFKTRRYFFIFITNYFIKPSMSMLGMFKVLCAHIYIYIQQAARTQRIFIVVIKYYEARVKSVFIIRI